MSRAGGASVNQSGCAVGGHRLQTFAQHGFDRRFPTGGDAQFFPQARRAIQTALLQPGAQFFVGFETLLQFFEGGEFGFGLVQGLARGLEFACVLRARGVQLWQRGLGFLEPGLRGCQGLRQLLEFDLLSGQPGRIRSRQL